MQTSCNRPNKCPGTGISPYNKSRPILTGDCYKCFITSYTTLNHIKKSTFLSTIESLEDCSFATSTNSPLSLPR